MSHEQHGRAPAWQRPLTDRPADSQTPDDGARLAVRYPLSPSEVLLWLHGDRRDGSNPYVSGVRPHAARVDAYECVHVSLPRGSPFYCSGSSDSRPSDFRNSLPTALLSAARRRRCARIAASSAAVVDGGGSDASADRRAMSCSSSPSLYPASAGSGTPAPY